jgi:hypothetical protein
MPHEVDENEESVRPVVIDISQRAQIRKERIVAIVLLILVLALAYIIYKSLH